MNKVILMGNLTKDPQLTTSANGISFTRFDLAVRRNRQNENGEYESDFFTIVTFGKTAENCNKYLKKGSKALISGSVQNRSYEAQDGSKRYVTEIIANEVEFIGGNQGTQNAQTQKTQQTVQQVEMTPIDDTDELPF